jgi:hypothetical protein
MDLDQVRTRARLELLPTSDGGRQEVLWGPVRYRPNHNFFGEADREMCMGEIELVEGQALAPGEAMSIEMTLWTWPALTRDLHEGRRWRLQEGAQLVGWGTILELLDGRN